MVVGANDHSLKASTMQSLTFSLQALLVRHEAYMQEAERERFDLNIKIEQLETDKKDLESQNAKTIEENRELLNQLEGLNSSVLDSETHIKSLEATLHSTQQELRRLEGLAAKTHELELQLISLELEQEKLQKTVISTEAEERSAIQRWKQAERRLQDVQDQLERIEREAREERERHVEVMGRMERQRAVERELDTAAGRLKGAAAASQTGGHHSNVVSHFVKDILQDNANLQLGIVELREMLMSSNDEVQTLREQLMLHQPLSTIEESNQSSLKAEIAAKEVKPEPVAISQELHIHHHYHTPKKEEARRPKKKRVSLNNALFTPPHHLRTPRGPETANAILSQTSVTIPHPSTPNNRWSMQSGQMSDFAPSSVPSSPQSGYRNSTLFDRGFDLDSSRPTSPGSSIDPMSPQFAPMRHRKKGSEVSTRSFFQNFQPDSVIHEEEDHDVEEIQNLHATHVPTLVEDITDSEISHESSLDSESHWSTALQPSLRRSTSHESILSISGIDIHTLKSRPSQMTITSSSLLRPRSRLAQPSTMTSIETITAQPVMSRTSTYNSTAYLRASGLAPSSTDARSISSSMTQSSSNSNESTPKKTGGGWIFGRWGVSPAKSTENLRAPPKRVVSQPQLDPLQTFMGRSPGINQRGPVPGLVRKPKMTPSMVKPVVVDHAALQEVLGEE